MMFSNSYATDTQTKSTDLSTAILAAVSPQQISACCAAIESFLHKLTPEQSRWFFSITFPTLICKVFGFDDSSPAQRSPRSPNGWIDLATASKDSELSGRVLNLLTPNAVLMSSISNADRLSLVKYVFPIERLPAWVRYMLQNLRDRRILADMCPLFRGMIKEDPNKSSPFYVQLNVFEYYMFWFAYYPVCRGNNENCDTVMVQRSKRFRLENWATSIPGLTSSKRGREQKLECNLYMQLLYAYLRAFVPIPDFTAHHPCRSSLLHYSSGHDGSLIEQAEFLVNTLIHFWLVDNDFSPFPVNMCKSFGVTFPSQSVLGGSPPTSGLGELVNILVKYLNLNSVLLPNGSDQLEYAESLRWRVAGSFDLKSRDATATSVGMRYSLSWISCIQRPLYRYILRTLLYCPMETSVKNVSQVFSIWINYMEPWMTSMTDFVELDSNLNASCESTKKDVTQSLSCGYSSDWQGFVLNNYLYYSSLVMHFIGFAHKFLHIDAEATVQMVSKVISILASSAELLDLIKNVDVVFHSKPTGSSKSSLNHLHRFVPMICEQLQDWEDGLCESDADGSFLHANWNKDLQLFSGGEDGGRQLIQLFVLRAESELQGLMGDNLAHSLQCLDSLKAQLGCLFGGSIAKSTVTMAEARHRMQFRDELFKPRRVWNHAVTDVKYKGDWMKRPISDDEVAWLAKLLVDLSGWLNNALGLNEGNCSHIDPSCSYVEFSDGDHTLCGPTEIMKVMFFSVCAWLITLRSAVVQFMRKFGLRVNLRIFASKKVVAALLMIATFSVLKKSIFSLW